MEIVNWFTIIGLIAQIAFAGRMIVQWVLSERAKEVVNPALFWWLSLVGSLTMSFYGYLREDLAIMLGQLVSYYVYIYNLKLKHEITRFGKLVALAIIVAPLVMLMLEIKDFASFYDSFLDGENIPYWLLAFGLCGQFLFTFRFIYQMVVSLHQRQSVLPLMFWYISMLAALMVQLYGLFRLDIVLILGQIGGMVTYMRNIKLHSKKKEEERAAKE